MRLRSLLYVPAHRDSFLARAAERGADALILDLEDSVPADAKSAARTGLADWIPRLRDAGARVFVRLNADTVADDARAATRAGADGLMLPKVASADTVATLCAALTDAGLTPPPMIATIEDPAALLRAADIAAAPGLIALALGGEDFATALNADPLPEVLRQPKLMVHYAAKAQGLLSFGLLQSIADYGDADALTRAAAEARKHGFDGATCVHPSVVSILNAAFAPGAEEVAHARRLIAAMQAAGARGEAAMSFEGRMVDAPVLKRAQRILREAD